MIYKIFGVIAILMALMCFSQYQYIPALVLAAIAAILLAKPKKKPPTDVVIVQDKSEAPASVASVPVIIHAVFPVAGVTFNNEDGSSRQEILRELCEGPLAGVDENCWMNPYLYNGEMALAVIAGGGCVGNIRKNDVQKVRDCIAASRHGARLEAELFETDDGREIYRADVIFDD